jgi:hypothetical protein
VRAIKPEILAEKQSLLVGRQISADGSLLRSGQTQVSEPKIGEHVQ